MTCSRKGALRGPFLISIALKNRHGAVLKLSSLVAAFHTVVCAGAAQGGAYVAEGAAKTAP